MKTIEKLLEPFGFSFGQLQDIATFLKQLKENNISVESFIGHVEAKKRERAEEIKAILAVSQKQRDTWALRALKCPACETPMYVAPVNTAPGDQTGDDSQSVWMCPKCWETVYSLETVAEILAGTE